MGSACPETRGWDENAGRTISQRSKEEANDYRYFPEPDLPPLRPSHDWIAEIREAMPELPAARRALRAGAGAVRLRRRVLTSDVALADYFDRVVATGDRAQVGRQLGDRRVQPPAEPACRGRAARLRRGLVAGRAGRADRRGGGGRVSGTNAKALLATVFASGESPRTVIEREGLGQVHDAGLIEREVAAVLAEFPEQVAQYRGGKQQIYGFLVGQVMKRTAGRADASWSTRSCDASWTLTRLLACAAAGVALGLASRTIDTGVGAILDRAGSVALARRALAGGRLGLPPWRRPGLGRRRRIHAADGDRRHVPGRGRRAADVMLPGLAFLAVTAGPAYGAAGAALWRGERGRLAAAATLGAALVAEGLLLQLGERSVLGGLSSWSKPRLAWCWRPGWPARARACWPSWPGCAARVELAVLATIGPALA